MKKYVYTLSACIAFISLILLSCEKKNSNDALTPTYKEEATGTAGNPHVNNVTVTGSVTNTNPATESTSLFVGGSGWSNPTCSSTGSLTLKGVNGSIDVTINFASIPALGTTTYAVSSNPGFGVCAMTVVNAPNQPAGIAWYGVKGTVSVQTTTSSINASFSSIECTQQSFQHPVVYVSGNIGCN